MKLIHIVIYFLVSKTSCLETCKNIQLSGSGDVDGAYDTRIDYRDRPDFYRDDRLYNLYGEEEGLVCYWRIDSAESEFPYYTSDDCAHHPVDIEEGWWVYRLDLAPEALALDVVCVEVGESDNKVMIYTFSSLSSLVLVVLLVWGHILLRKRRLRKAKRECPVCRKSANDAARVVQAAFRQNSSRTLT